MTRTRTPVGIDDVLAIERSVETAVVATIHDRADFCFDVACSVHGRLYVYGYSKGATVADIEHGRQDAIDFASVHAENCYLKPPRAATSGSPS